MNLQHERLQILCEGLNLPMIAQGYAAASQQAAQLAAKNAMQTGLGMMNRPQPQPMTQPVMQRQQQQVRPMASLGQQPGLLNSFQRRRFG